MEPKKIIAYVTDTHLGQQLQISEALGNGKMSYAINEDEHKDNFILILDDIQKRGINEVIFGGDIGSKESNRWFFNLIKKYQFNLWMVLGNHDTFSEVRQHYTNVFINENIEMNYCYEDRYFKYIFLDSSTSEISPQQFDWLKGELKTIKKVLIFIHHPVLEINTPLDRIGAALKGRDTLKKLLIDSTKEIIIFCGHYHMLDESVEKNIKQICTLAGSYQITKKSSEIKIDQHTFGYRLITIDNDHIKTDVVTFKK